MIDLTKSTLPSTVEVNGSVFYLHTDFRFWINFILKTKDLESQPVNAFDYLFAGDIPEDKIKAFDALCNFAFPKSELPRKVGVPKSDIIAYDWVLDADYIYAAFYQQYQIDLVDESCKLHWYKFMALFNALKDTKFDEIVTYRFFSPGATYDADKERLKLRQMWEIKYQLTQKEQETVNKFREKLKC